MLYELFQKYKVLIITVGLVVGLSLISFFVYKNFFTLYITGTTPNTTSVSTSTPQITASFNKDLDPESVAVEAEDVKTSVVISGSKLRINIFTVMTQNQPYTIKISASSKDGYTFSETLRFEPRAVQSYLSTRDKQLILLRQQGNKPASMGDTIYEHLPISNLSYEITTVVDSTLPAPSIIIKVAIPLTAVESRTDRAGAFEKKKAEAKQKLESLSEIDISKYPVVYVISGEGI